MGLARLEARVLECLPGKLLTRDQLLMLERDNVVAPGAADLAALDIVADADGIGGAGVFAPVPPGRRDASGRIGPERSC